MLQILEFNQERAVQEAWNHLGGIQRDYFELRCIPHYKIDCNIDGVVVFKCSESGEVIPILCSIHSVSKSAKEEDQHTEYIFEKRYPFVVGFFHGKTKPTPEELMEALLRELEYLDPANTCPETEGRLFTASLHCMKCDTPIRYYTFEIVYFNIII